MSSFKWPDLSSLASLARDQNLDVRPVLLRVHTDLFLGASSRDTDTIKAFEALALGFLPIVDEATATVVARKLASFPDTPPAVLDALIERGGEPRVAVLEGLSIMEQKPDAMRDGDMRRLRLLARRKDLTANQIAELLSAADAEIDLVLVENGEAPLGPADLQQLAERGRDRPDLAAALLTRRLGPHEEAVLYLYADKQRRAQIRSRLEAVATLTASGTGPSRAGQDTVDCLLACAAARDGDAFGRQLAHLFGLRFMPAWNFHLQGRRELLAFALVAAGVSNEDCIRIFLSLEPAIARSVEAVFQLAQIARTVSRPVAIYLVEAILGIRLEAQREGRYVPASDPARAFSRTSAAQPVATRKAPAEHRAG